MNPTAPSLEEPSTELLAPEDPVADPRRRRLILIAMCTALVAVVASVSGLNVAQQQLAVDLGATQSQLLWVINGYTIALAALLLPIGAIGDRFGRKKVLVSGLVLFVAANLAAAFAGSVTFLLVARIAAGVGAAMIMPVTLSVITSTFPAEDRDRAVGVWAGFAGAGGILGLVTSSIVIDNFTWPWVFAVPVVMGAIAFFMTVVVVPHSREHMEGRFDVLGSVLSAVAVGASVLAIHEGPEAGWTDPITVAGLVLGGGAAIGFVLWELRQSHPLLDLRVFRNRMLTAGSVSLLAVFAILMALFLVLVQFLQAGLGYSAIKASASLLPLALIMMPLSSIAPLLARRVGMRSMFVGGISLVAVGLALMATMASVAGGYLSVLPGLVVLAVGVGLTMTPGTTAITGSLPVGEQGVASALNDTVRELGGALGVALIGSVLSAAYSSSVADATAGLPPEAATAVREGIGGAVAVSSRMGPQGASVLEAARVAFVDGWAASMWISAGLAVAAALFALVWTPSRRAEHASRDELAAAAENGAVIDLSADPAAVTSAGLLGGAVPVAATATR
jgi:EmrB/QacA subfamily drug resistance transporter